MRTVAQQLPHSGARVARKMFASGFFLGAISGSVLLLASFNSVWIRVLFR